MLYSKYNDPKMYNNVTNALISKPIPTKAAFVAQEDEKIVPTFVVYRTLPIETLRDNLDNIERTILEVVALSKYLTSLQIYEYITLRGCDITREKLRRKLLRLMKLRVLKENELVASGAESGLKYYEIDYYGYLLARESKIVFHMGNRYVSYLQKKNREIPDDTPCDVKRILVGNQIVIGLLLSNAKMERFGIMETFRGNDNNEIESGCIIRTTVNIRIDQSSVLIYDVVRDTPEAYINLKNKVERYYRLVNSINYLDANHHGDKTYPQLIICGESLIHNIKIAEFLRSNDMLNDMDPILFTEDLLNINSSLTSIYSLDEKNNQYWYSLPVALEYDKEIA